MLAFGVVFLTTSVLIIFKREEKMTNSEDRMGLLESYLVIKRLLSLRSIQKVAIILLTVKVILI